MRRLTAKLAATLALLTAALLPGAAVLLSPVAAQSGSCPPPLDEAALEALVLASDVIVLGTVTAVTYLDHEGVATFGVVPEAFLKGRTSAAEQEFRGTGAPMPEGGCGPEADVRSGDRVLVFGRGAGPFAWPSPEAAFVQEGDVWRSANPADTATYSEGQLLARIRGLTGQYSVPATGDDDSAGIDWAGTIVPVGAVLVGLMAVGLVLMRIWHRIDPS